MQLLRSHQHHACRVHMTGCAILFTLCSICSEQYFFLSFQLNNSLGQDPCQVATDLCHACRPIRRTSNAAWLRYTCSHWLLMKIRVIANWTSFRMKAITIRMSRGQSLATAARSSGCSWGRAVHVREERQQFFRTYIFFGMYVELLIDRR